MTFKSNSLGTGTVRKAGDGVGVHLQEPGGAVALGLGAGAGGQQDGGGHKKAWKG